MGRTKKQNKKQNKPWYFKKGNDERRSIGTPNVILPESSCSRKRYPQSVFNFYGP